MGAFGWGDAIGKIFDWLPGRRESIRNRIDKTKREMDELSKKKWDARVSARYSDLAVRLRKLQNEAENN